jgi:hypothetical protein
MDAILEQITETAMALQWHAQATTGLVRYDKRKKPVTNRMEYVRQSLAKLQELAAQLEAAQ